MEIQDKIGRDQAKLFLKEFEAVHEWFRPRVEIFKNTEMYKFYINKKMYQFNENRNFVLCRKQRNWESGQIILPLEVTRLKEAKIINEEEADSLGLMIKSKDDYLIAEMSINILRNQRLKKGYARKKN